MADGEHRAGDLIDEAGGVGGVVGDAAQRIGGGDDRDPLSLQALDDAAPARAVGERAMDEHDGEGAAAVAAGVASVMGDSSWARRRTRQ